MSIVDYYSRKLWLFILKNKNNAHETFKSWRTLIENQTGKIMKRLRTNNGLEYCANELTEYCKKNGIARHRIVAGTPQKNGLAERFNRTILERVRCMLISSGLPKVFWVEAIVTA